MRKMWYKCFSRQFINQYFYIYFLKSIKFLLVKYLPRSSLPSLTLLFKTFLAQYSVFLYFYIPYVFITIHSSLKPLYYPPLSHAPLCHILLILMSINTYFIPSNTQTQQYILYSLVIKEAIDSLRSCFIKNMAVF